MGTGRKQWTHRDTAARNGQRHQGAVGRLWTRLLSGHVRAAGDSTEGGGHEKKDMEVKSEHPKIMVETAGGQAIPEVEKVRVLGQLVEQNQVNGETVNKLAGKAAAAMRLTKRVSNRRVGLKGESLTRLVQSFAVSHITHVAAFHNWRPSERNKIDATIRETYKAALGLFRSLSIETIMALGVHNTLDKQPRHRERHNSSVSLK